MIETNVHHILRCLREARRRGAGEVEVRTRAHDEYFEYIQQKQRLAPILNNNCASSNTYYIDHHGDAPLLRPLSSFEMWRQARTFPLDDYIYAPAQVASLTSSAETA
jgi:hypothetical protein